MGGTHTLWSYDDQKADAEIVINAVRNLSGPGSNDHASFRPPNNTGELRVPHASGVRVLYFEMGFHTWVGEVDWLRPVEAPAKMVSAGIRALLG
jgi:hypothetical protein